MLITAYLALATTMLALPSPELAKGTGLVIVTLLFTKHTASATKRKNRIEKAIDDAYVEIDRVLKKLS